MTHPFCGVSWQELTSLSSHSVQIPTQQPQLPLELSLGPGSPACVMSLPYFIHVDGVFGWPQLETGTQSLLPVNTNLMGLTGQGEPRWLGEDGMYKR